jgi:hypothetical protein
MRRLTLLISLMLGGAMLASVAPAGAIEILPGPTPMADPAQAAPAQADPHPAPPKVPAPKPPTLEGPLPHPTMFPGADPEIWPMPRAKFLVVHNGQVWLCTSVGNVPPPGHDHHGAPSFYWKLPGTLYACYLIPGGRPIVDGPIPSSGSPFGTGVRVTERERGRRVITNSQGSIWECFLEIPAGRGWPDVIWTEGEYAWLCYRIRPAA